jgi:uncharacterized protein (TIGR02722 family)
MTLIAVGMTLSGCSAFRASISDEDPSTSTALSAKYDHRDLLTWADLISKDIMEHPFPDKEDDNPIIVVMGIQNRTRTHADMKSISDTITTKLLDEKKIRLVNAARRDDLLKEQGYKLANCTDETKSQIGRQLGAKYMLTGSLVEIGSKSGREVRLSKKEDVYYQLTVEITDLESGLIAVRKQRDRLRRASKPLIGW